MKAQNHTTNAGEPEKADTRYMTLGQVLRKDPCKAITCYVQLGRIMLKEAGEQACLAGYGTTDPEWVGRHALAFGDINPDGTLN